MNIPDIYLTLCQRKASALLTFQEFVKPTNVPLRSRESDSLIEILSDRKTSYGILFVISDEYDIEAGTMSCFLELLGLTYM